VTPRTVKHDESHQVVCVLQETGTLDKVIYLWAGKPFPALPVHSALLTFTDLSDGRFDASGPDSEWSIWFQDGKILHDWPCGQS
jgi:hypothetical protein